MSSTLESTGQPVTVRSRWSDDDVPSELVPERYRLGEAFVPKGRYLDPEFQQLEIDRLFARTWLMACRLEELPGVGSYVEYLIGSHSILVVRESNDSIRGYFNACRHRGTRLATGRGRVGALICPFHGWRWNLDGSIRLVLDREEFVPRSDEDLGLETVKVDTWGGFVFINMDPTAEPLLEYLDPIPAVCEPFHFENMRYRWMKGVTVPCNWKTVLDGFLEAYHVPGTHPQLTRWDKRNHNIATLKELDRRAWSPTATFGKFARYASLGPKKGAGSIFDATNGPIEAAEREELGKDPANKHIEGASDERRSIADAVQYIANDMKALETERSIRVSEKLRTADVPEGMSAGQYYLEMLRDEAIADGLDWPVISSKEWAAAGTAWHVFPNTILLPNQGCIIGYRARPNGKDPDSCLFEAFSLEQIPVADYDKKNTDFEPQYFDDYRDADVGEVLTQDLDNSENVTVGMHSPSFDGHRLSTAQEMTIYNHHRAADHYLWTD
jgi:Rieske 2Fe-2S family protein